MTDNKIFYNNLSQCTVKLGKLACDFGRSDYRLIAGAWQAESCRERLQTGRFLVLRAELDRRRRGSDKELLSGTLRGPAN